MALTMSTGDAILKELYPENVMKNMTYQDNPFLGMVPKFEKAGGRHIVVPVTYANPAGRSADFSTALSSKGNSEQVQFLVTRVSDYSLASIGNEIIEASKVGGNQGAFVDALQYEIDNAINSISNSLASALFRSGTGSIGEVASVTVANADTSNIANSGKFTLTNINDVVNFEKGMKLQHALTDGGAVLDAETFTVDYVDRDTGTIYCDTDLTTNVAVGDFIYQAGDRNAKLKGLDAWLPSSAPTNTAFFGVDRSVDTRLGGVRVSASDVSGLTVEEKLQFALARLGREGARPDKVFVSFERYRDLVYSLGSKVVYDGVKVADVGFEGVRIIGPKGPVTVYADRYCQNDVAWVLQMDTWKLHSVNAAPHILSLDGKLMREASSDAYEVRIGYYAQLACSAPGWNCRVDLS